MSFSYTKLVPKPPPTKMYGFQKVNNQDLNGIVQRLQKKTYSAEFSHGECFRTKPSPPRPPSAYCKKAPLCGSESGYRHRRKQPVPSDKELDKIVRRLRTPTVSLLAACELLDPAYEERIRPPIPDTDKIGGKRSRRPKTAQEKQKIMSRIMRPTTATRSKSANRCVFCDDPDMEQYMDCDFSEGRVATQDELEDIVDRVCVPTSASAGGYYNCQKRPHSTNHRCVSWASRDKLPLVSGLPRSQGVDEIVGRLYAPTFAIPISRAHSAPAAAQRQHHA